MKKHLFWDNSENVAQLVTSLAVGNISICTTDTVLGLLATVTKNSFELLNKIKGRYEKPYLILVPSKEEVEELVDLKTNKLKDLIESVWPGPVTLIFKAKAKVPDFMKSNQGTIALRIPAHQGLQAVMKVVGPLFSTSANLAGQVIPETVEKINPEILKEIEYIVTDRKDSGEALPSTIIDCTDPEKIKIIRQGSFKINL
jgi:L-threonylcarbamoyladenylate synthase